METIKLNLVVEKTPVDVGGGKTIYLDLKDTSVLERAETAQNKVSAIMGQIPQVKEGLTDMEALTQVAEIIRTANTAAKQAIDHIFDTDISKTIWGNSSCIALGDTADDNRFSRAVGALLELYAPALREMAKDIENTSDAFADEVLANEVLCNS